MTDDSCFAIVNDRTAAPNLLVRITYKVLDRIQAGKDHQCFYRSLFAQDILHGSAIPNLPFSIYRLLYCIQE